MDDAANFRAMQVLLGGGHDPLSPPHPKHPIGRPHPLTPPSPPPKDAMAIIGFAPAEVTALLEVTAVVLKLGNVKLSSCFQASGMEASSIAEPRGTASRVGGGG